MDGGHSYHEEHRVSYKPRDDAGPRDPFANHIHLRREVVTTKKVLEDLEDQAWETEMGLD